ncbi:MAG: hypothetical protein LBM63_03380 [Rikenellaceae bacterium]|jgi:hypothetical protein|nr:hypothetical protein [Rikenellaceae bacterium]
MDERRKLPVWSKAVIAVGAVLLLGLAVMLGAEAWARHKIRISIETEAIEVAGMPLTVKVGRVGVSLARRSLSIHDISFHSPNTNPEKADSVAIVSLSGSIKQVSIRGIGYRKTGGKPALSARELLVDAPLGTLVTRALEKTTNRPEKKDFRQAVTERFCSVAVERVELRDANIEYASWVTPEEETRAKLAGGVLVANGFRIDTLPASDKILFCRNIELDVAALSYGYASGAMVAEVDSLSARSQGTISAAALRLVPQFAKDEYAQKSKGHKDWMQVEVTDVQGWGVDFKRMIASEIVSVDSVQIGSADIASYKNKQVYQEPVTKPLLWQTLQNLPIPLDIRRVGFRDVAVRYDELSPTGTAPGTVHFSQGQGEVLGVTNITEGHDPYFTVNVSAMLMDSTLVNATCEFPVSPSLDHFSITGSVGRSYMTTFNPVLTPLMNVRVDSGVMNSLAFELRGTHIASHVEMTMLYEGLSVALLKAHDHSRKRGFLTFVANDILIKDANPTSGGRVRTASGNFTRDPHRSTFNYIWKSFVPAITKTVL